MADEKIKIVRDHVEIELEHCRLRINIDAVSGCKECIVINKFALDDSSRICIVPKVSNEIEVF